MNPLPIYIITGRSGSGKSTAIDAFEDAGYYCVDNMPVALLPKFLELPLQGHADLKGLAFVMDLREKDFITSYASIFNRLRRRGYEFCILFLEAEEDILYQRYSETRRHHPLSQGKTLLDSIRMEKETLEDLRAAADDIIDTSHFNVHKLKAAIMDMIRSGENGEGITSALRVSVKSFGFKYGIPQDADLIVDVRFLPNPYFDPELKELTGEDKAVRDFIFADAVTATFLDKYLDLLDYLMPLYEKEGKAYLTLAVGCTGGRHRSVAIAREIFRHIQTMGKPTELSHRDIGQ